MKFIGKMILYHWIILFTVFAVTSCIQSETPAEGVLTMVIGESQTFSVTAEGALQWYRNGRPLWSENDDSYTFDALDTGTYQIKVVEFYLGFFDHRVWKVHVVSGPNDLFYADADGDGFGNPAVSSVEDMPGYVNNNTDCNDSDKNIYPGAVEIDCDGIDQNCNGVDYCPVKYCADNDGDTFGNPYECEVIEDMPPAGFVQDDTDCDDHDGMVFPGAWFEVCGDGVDSNCDDFDCPDLDGDTHPSDMDCNDADPTIHPGASEICGDGIDQNCDGINPMCDGDMDGYAADVDCNENDPNIHPDAVDICNDGVDQDCDGSDAACPDNDGDGYPSDQECNDDDPAIHPGAAEICGDGVDSNCDTFDCPDGDHDGYTSDLDCNDGNATIHPGAEETCKDGIDQNCDGIDAACLRAPFNITATFMTQPYVAIAWDMVPGADYYKVYRADTPDGEYTLVSPDDDTIRGTGWNYVEEWADIAAAIGPVPQDLDFPTTSDWQTALLTHAETVRTLVPRFKKAGYFKVRAFGYDGGSSALSDAFAFGQADLMHSAEFSEFFEIIRLYIGAPSLYAISEACMGFDGFQYWVLNPPFEGPCGGDTTLEMQGSMLQVEARHSYHGYAAGDCAERIWIFDGDLEWIFNTTEPQPPGGAIYNGADAITLSVSGEYDGSVDIPSLVIYCSDISATCAETVNVIYNGVSHSFFLGY